MEADGSKRTRVPNYHENCSDPNWTNDGSRIVFVENGDIYTMKTDGSQKTKLTNYAWETHEGGCSNPSWSQDDSRIAFLINGRPHVINTDGSNEYRLTTNVDLYSEPELVWSPDGQHLAFVTPWVKDNVHFGDICIVNVDGSGHHTIVSPHNGDYTSPSWSPESKRIAFHDLSHVYAANSDGSNLIKLPAFSSVDHLARGSHLDWSPNDSRIAYCARGIENRNNVYLIDADSSNKMRLTDYDDKWPWAGGYYYAIWSPDGSRIVYFFRQNDDSFDVCIMNADGSNQIKLTNLVFDSIGIFWSY